MKSDHDTRTTAVRLLRWYAKARGRAMTIHRLLDQLAKSEKSRDLRLKVVLNQLEMLERLECKQVEMRAEIERLQVELRKARETTRLAVCKLQAFEQWTVD